MKAGRIERCIELVTETGLGCNVCPVQAFKWMNAVVQIVWFRSWKTWPMNKGKTIQHSVFFFPLKYRGDFKI